MNPTGVFMTGLDGLALTRDEKALLGHPLVGGVILFARNYRNKEQLAGLVAAVRAAKPGLVVAVDQESARVQRLREDFTRLPAPGALGRSYDLDPDVALRTARAFGRVVAAELRRVDIDFSFAPVLDLNTGNSRVIGDRAFHAAADTVAALGRSFIDGLHDAGMMAVGKHFPGHGSVAGDTHDEVTRDEREYDEIAAGDLRPFQALMHAGVLDAVMLSHVVHVHMDKQPASLSEYWLREVLRDGLGFTGLAFSDDLAMAGSNRPGADDLRRAFDAGCDMALVCNDRALLQDLLAGFAGDEIERYSNAAARRWEGVRAALAAMPQEPFDYNEAAAELAQFA